MGEPTTWWYWSNQHHEHRAVDIRLTFEDLESDALIAQERALRSFLEQNCQWQLPQIDLCGWIYDGDLPPEPEPTTEAAAADDSPDSRESSSEESGPVPGIFTQILEGFFLLLPL